MIRILLKSIALTCIVVLFSCGNKAQKSNTLNGEFKGDLNITKVEIQTFGVDIKTVKDTIVTDNKFKLTIPSQLTTGMYKLKYFVGEESSSFDFIITNKESIDFEITLSKTEFIPPVFKTSEINTNYFNQIRTNTTFFQDINKNKNEWAVIEDKSSEKADSLSQIITSLIKSQKETVAKIDSKFPFLKLLIENSFTTPYFDKNLTPREQDSVTIKNYWNNIDANKPELINSTVYASTIYNFVNYYSSLNAHLSHVEQVAKSKESIDIILKDFTNSETREFAINYLTFGFKQLGREDIMQYIDETYATVEQCENPEALKTRLEGYSKIKAGNVAPDLIFDGENALDQITDTTLVVFWATWCEHCRDEIPALFQYQEQTKLKVISISLDTDKAQYEGAKSQLPTFTHYCDFKQWDSPSVKSYFVKGTPTFVLIDGNKKIIGKYISINDVIGVMGQ